MINIVDIMNLTTLSRKGISVLSDQIDPQHAEAGWKAIKNAEAMIAQYQQQQQQQKDSAEQVDGTNVEVVNINNNDTVEEETE